MVCETASNNITNHYGWTINNKNPEIFKHLESGVGVNSNYIEDEDHKVTSISIEIDKSRYEAANAFPDLVLSGMIPSFDLKYNILTNSCVDFSSSALAHIGLADAGFEGILDFPASKQNIDSVIKQMWKNAPQGSIIHVENYPFKSKEFDIDIGDSVNPVLHIIDKISYQSFKIPSLSSLEGYFKNASNLFHDFINNIFRQDQYRIIDPLALDLDGDGIETVGINGFDSVLFDHKNNGIRSATGWIGKDDALLVLDRNQDGKIDTGLELFGDNTVLRDGTKAHTGYQALAEFDDNGDGMIDEQDAIFAQLRAWQDKNQDGISQSDELLNMSEARVKALHLNHQNTHKNLGNGNVLARHGSYIKTDNTEAEMGDLHFASNLMLSNIDTAGIELNESLKLLPNLKGMGRLKDLRFAAAESEQLTNLLTQYSNTQTKQEQSALLDQLLIAWAKTDHLKALSGFDARLEMSSLSIQANDDDKNVILVTRAEYEALMRKRAAGLLPTHYEIPEIAFKVGILDSFTGQNSPKLYDGIIEQAPKIL